MCVFVYVHTYPCICVSVYMYACAYLCMQMYIYFVHDGCFRQSQNIPAVKLEFLYHCFKTIASL